jgi:hypothetical protein
MTAAIVALALLVGALLAVLVIRERDHDTALDAKDERHRDEVRELTTRIQHPQLIPRPRPAAQQSGPPPDHKAYAAIGTLTAVKPGEQDG